MIKSASRGKRKNFVIARVLRAKFAMAAAKPGRPKRKRRTAPKVRCRRKPLPKPKFTRRRVPRPKR